MQISRSFFSFLIGLLLPFIFLLGITRLIKSGKVIFTCGALIYFLIFISHNGFLKGYINASIMFLVALNPIWVEKLSGIVDLSKNRLLYFALLFFVPTCHIIYYLLLGGFDMSRLDLSQGFTVSNSQAEFALYVASLLSYVTYFSAMYLTIFLPYRSESHSIKN